MRSTYLPIVQGLQRRRLLLRLLHRRPRHPAKVAAFLLLLRLLPERRLLRELRDNRLRLPGPRSLRTTSKL